MARNTTRQGANYELVIMHFLKEFGYDAWRSSGSRGAIDVTAVGPRAVNPFWKGEVPDGGPLLFIQAKRNQIYLGPADAKRVHDLAVRAGAVPLLSSMTEDAECGLKRPHFWVIDPTTTPSKWAPWEPGEDE